jgi:hypothetical protein
MFGGSTDRPFSEPTSDGDFVTRIDTTYLKLRGLDYAELVGARHEEKLGAVVDHILTKQVAFTRCKSKRERFVTMHSAVIRKICGGNTRTQAIVTTALEKIMDSDCTYIVGEKSIGRKVKDELLANGLDLGEHLDTRLLARLAILEAERIDSENRTPVHAHLERHLRELSIDETESAQFTGGRISRRKLHALNAIAMINSKKFRLLVDEYGRCHSNITNLWSRLRPALRYRRVNRLHEIDVANCQPTLVGVMAAQVELGRWTIDQLKVLGSKNADGSHKWEREGRERRARQRREPTHSPYEALKLLNLPCGPVNRDLLPPDLRDYLGVCERGEFYEELARVWHARTDDPERRKALKRVAYRVIFFGRIRTEADRTYILWRAFCDRWPTVGHLILRLKNRDKGVPARACQRLESTIMIQGVCGRLMDSHPATPVLTIHDSILTLPGHAGLVGNTIQEEFQRFGVTPNLK